MHGGRSGARAPGGSARIVVPELGICSGPVCSSYPYAGLKNQLRVLFAVVVRVHPEEGPRLLSCQDIEAGGRVHCRAIAPPAIAIAITFKVRVDRTWTGTEQDTYHRPDYKVPRYQHVQLDPISTDEMDHGWPHRENAALRRPRAAAHLRTHVRAYSGPATSVRAVKETQSAGPTNVRCVAFRIVSATRT